MWDVFANQSENFDSFAAHSLLFLFIILASPFLGSSLRFILAPKEIDASSGRQK